MYSIKTSKLTKKFKDKIAVNEIDLFIKYLNSFPLSMYDEYWSKLWAPGENNITNFSNL